MACTVVCAAIGIVAFDFHIGVTKVDLDDIALLVINIHREFLGTVCCSKRLVERDGASLILGFIDAFLHGIVPSNLVLPRRNFAAGVAGNNMLHQPREPSIQALTRGIFCRIHNRHGAHNVNKLFQNGCHGRKDGNFDARLPNNRITADRRAVPGRVLGIVLTESKLPFRGRRWWTRHARSAMLIGVLRDPQIHLIHHARFRDRKLRLHLLMGQTDRDMEGIGAIA